MGVLKVRWRSRKPLSVKGPMEASKA
uniref:Uncharacterized protein n=1 Tax=Anguilla anguilla TaxID=7936 RepID=A0A0E9V6N3_ANGAN